MTRRRQPKGFACLASGLLALAGAACSPSSPAPPEADAAPTAPTWKAVVENLDGALLSVWGPSSKEIYAVGGPLGNDGFESLVLRYDGARWTRLRPGGPASFWWVSGTSSTDVWLVGEKGRITHYDGRAFVEYPPLTTSTLYGVWAASPSDAYAVGGKAEGGSGPDNDVLLHWNGTAWARESLPVQAGQEGRALFKVWGRSASDVYVVGEAGLIWHRSGGVWQREANSPPLARGTLLTVFGCESGPVYAVGGRDVLRRDDARSEWRRVEVELLNDVNGGACARDGSVVLVGLGGLKQRYVQNQWFDDFGTKPYADLHGAFVDSEGALWGVGGGFLGAVKPNVRRNGVIARFGATPVSSELVP